MTSSIFSIKRFGNALSLEFGQKSRRLLMYCALVVGILIAVSLFMTYNNASHSYWRGTYDGMLSYLLPLYVILLFLYGALSASIMWTEMKNKVGRTAALMNPASYLEKYLVKFTIYVLLFLVVYAAAVFIAETVRYLAVSVFVPEGKVKPVPLYLIGKYDSETIKEILGSFTENSVILYCIFGFFALQSLFVLGSIIWTRNSYIKSFACFGGIALVYLLTAMWTIESVDGGRWVETPPLFAWIEAHKTLCIIVLFGFVTVLNWTLAWFRLRETDVISVKR